MRTAVLAWEQGANWGHVVRLQAMAAWLQSKNTRVVLAVSQSLMASHKAQILQFSCIKVIVKEPERSSTARVACETPQQANSYADVLLMQGWRDQQWLSQAFRSWLHVLRTWDAQMVVADYAPLALWTAAVLELPCVHVSSGFDAPSADWPLFSALISGHPSQTALPRHDLSLLQQSMDHACSDANLQAHQVQRSRLDHVLGHPQRLLDALPQTDIYGPRPVGDYAVFRPIHEAMMSTPQWPQPAVHRSQSAIKLFAYLRDPAMLDAVFSLAKRQALCAIVVFPGAPDGLDAPQGVLIQKHIANLDAVLNGCHVVMSYGSIGLASRAVLAGRPHLLIPTDIEKLLLAKRIVAQGLGIALNPTSVSHALAQGIEQLTGGAFGQTMHDSSRAPSKPADFEECFMGLVTPWLA